jgi:DNA repair exonuclease SbcCD ATPase subunit
LELNNKTKDETIQRLNSEIATVHKIKGEYDSLKAQVSNAEMFRNQLVKERESHEKTKSLVEELKQRIEILEAPPKKKKTVKSAPVVEEPVLIVQQPVTEETAVRDGGSF